MDQEGFENLLQRYTRGECTQEEMLRVQLWFKKIEDQERTGLSDDEKSIIQGRLLKNIEYRIDPVLNSLPAKRTFWHSGNSRFLYAGIAAALIMTTIWLTRDQKNIGEIFAGQHKVIAWTASKTEIRENKTPANQLITLEDKSTVLLAPGSSISYLTHFEKARREIRLKGNAFFEVTKNPERPFLVYCGGTVTQVIGTSFWIKTRKDSRSVEVAVKTGKVSVSEEIVNNIDGNPPLLENTVFLKPNQRVIFFAEKRKIEPMLVESPMLLESSETKPDQFIYNDAPLSEVLQDLTSGYGIEILTSNDKLKSCSFTGDLSEMSFDEKFEIVCESIGTKYKKQGTSILLTGDGCK
jgi:transmembrane sensor